VIQQDIIAMLLVMLRKFTAGFLAVVAFLAPLPASAQESSAGNLVERSLNPNVPRWKFSSLLND